MTKDKIIIAGIDIAVKRNSAYAIYKLKKDEDRIEECIGIGKRPLYEILREISVATIIVVDAPLYPPYSGFRSVERKAMKSISAKFLPGGLPGMRMLSRIGYSLLLFSYESGLIIIESHPGSIKKLLNLDDYKIDRDIQDALIALMVGYCLLKGKTVTFVDVDGLIVLIKDERCRDTYKSLIKKCLFLL